MLWIALAICPRAFALNPSIDISQYVHTSWKVRDGFINGVIQALAQTRDGYLWLGTSDGLYRFDGIRAVRWEPPATAPVRTIGNVLALVAARDGTLWIGGDVGLATLKEGAFTIVRTRPSESVARLIEDRDGAIWMATGSPASDHPSLVLVCRVDRGGVECTGVTDVAYVAALFGDSSGNLWVGFERGIARWTPAPARRFALRPQLNGYMALAEEDGALLVGTPEGLARFADGKTELVHPSPPSVKPVPALAALRDRDGGLWMATYGRGIWRVLGGRTNAFTAADGLSADTALALLEDREGSVWVATADGLDRFRDVVTPTYAASRTFSNGAVTSILAAQDGSLWVGTLDGLNHWDRDHLTVYRENPRSVPGGARQLVSPAFPERVYSLFQDKTRRIWVSDRRAAGYLDGDKFMPVVDIDNATLPLLGEDGRGDIWVSTRNQLVRVRRDDTIDSIPFREFGTSTYATATAAASGSGVLWLGFVDGSVVYYHDDRVERRYSAADINGGIVNHLRADRYGVIWAATQRGLVRIGDTGVATLNAVGGLPCDSVQWSVPDEAGSVWLSMSCGLVRVPQQDLDLWAHRNNQRQAAGPRVRYALFDSVDGIRRFTDPAAVPRQPQVTKSRDGRIWFSTVDGVAVIDPQQIRTNSLAPPVQIEELVADRKTFDAVSGLRLPPRVRDLQIQYTALSLVAPEKNRFRVKLEGRDSDWQDVGTRRQAFYTDLGPGTYHFRVVASNNSGVWNETGAALEFSIAPAYYQTRWFAALVFVGTVALLWVAYQFRMRQVAHQFTRMLDARISERTRIARDLHDTLLQSFQGTLLLVQVAANVVKTRPDEASERLDRALDQAAAAITEGRNAVQGLRASAMTLNDLANGIAAIGAELTSNPAVVDAPAISVDVDGASRDLNPVVRDEAYRIAGEALRNAFNHAHARHVVVTIHYESRQFRLIVRDDGKGIDQTMQRQQVAGHFGLPGMRERAAIVKGQVDVRSAPGAGTEIELRVPAVIAYGAAEGRSWWSRIFGL